MCLETVAMAGVAVSAIGLGLGLYIHHEDKMDKKKGKEKEQAEYSIGRNVAGLSPYLQFFQSIRNLEIFARHR